MPVENMSQNMSQTVSIYFKVIYTDRTARYDIPLTSTLHSMIEYMKIRSCLDFNLAEIELVEAGQPLSENAPALVPEDTTLEQKYGDRLDTLAFYIRPIQQNPPLSSQYQCVICLNDDLGMNVYRYYGCLHPLCDGCVVQCVRRNIQQCSICRQMRRNSHPPIFVENRIE